ncbi:S53 family peptidase [Undibacterium terreum]|uniref:Kumamolisin n=1 Tax=Undibacterium terreum TaxID=1224302 RepID=A0A916UBW9_9BURK|nr:S53 family peptidase [Undibacterium terreum]GGC66572.1 kumamolisin [Undibacterium terreum]
MASNSTHTIVAGSERKPMRGAHSLGPVQPDQQVEITIRLRDKSGSQTTGTHATSADTHPAARGYMTREEFAAAHGASASDIAAIKAFAELHQLVLVATDAAQRSMILSGTAAAMNKAFGVTLEEYEHPDGTYRGRVGHVSVPADIAAIVEGVFGLDDRPQATTKFKIKRLADAPVAHAAANGSFTPPELAKLYNFPPGLDGKGQCIGIIELGGGTRPADIKTYFSSLGLATPNVKVISVDHAKNRPTTSDSADGEVMLDIEVAGAVAPKATIAVYFAPNTDRGFLDAITTAVHDKVNKPSVISISWGSAEVHWTAQAMASFEQAFADAAAMGVTICAAAGDNGSTDGETDGSQNVDFPASAPHALGCGGTKLVVSATGALTETVWNEAADSATGGGFSTHFPVPSYQTALGKALTGRGVPDVAGDADPTSGYAVRVDGKNLVIGGTSAVAPLWAGLIALFNQKLGHPVGFLNPLLYGSLKGKGVTRDITQGNNGAQKAATGWDACTGWGTPDGLKLLQALSS